jgi:hypothetical protein
MIPWFFGQFVRAQILWTFWNSTFAMSAASLCLDNGRELIKGQQKFN